MERRRGRRGAGEEGDEGSHAPSGRLEPKPGRLFLPDSRLPERELEASLARRRATSSGEAPGSGGARRSRARAGGLYLDAVVLPYYTGADALRWSRFSGECATCLCRMEPLVVGGRAVLYRGLSKTALAIIFALCSRMVCRIYGEERLSAWTRSALEVTSWVLVAGDAVYLAGWALAEGAAASVAGLVFLCVFGKVYRFLAWVESSRCSQVSNPSSTAWSPLLQRTTEAAHDVGG